MAPEAMVFMLALGVIHWVMAVTTLDIMFSHNRVLGGKGLWGVVIVSFTCVGSLAYLLLHPQEA